MSKGRPGQAFCRPAAPRENGQRAESRPCLFPSSKLTANCLSHSFSHDRREKGRKRKQVLLFRKVFSYGLRKKRIHASLKQWLAYRIVSLYQKNLSPAESKNHAKIFLKIMPVPTDSLLQKWNGLLHLFSFLFPPHTNQLHVRVLTSDHVGYLEEYRTQNQGTLF